MSRRVAAALLHYPVLDRQRQVVTTAVTNLDVHDIARSAHTYGLEAFYIVQPVAAQRELVMKIREHWVEGSGARRIPDRRPPLESMRCVESFERAIDDFAQGDRAETWVTTAQHHDAARSHVWARTRLCEPGPPVLLVFGTGWGLSPDVLSAATAILEPIVSPRADRYNHLSVRAAAAIIFDRLLSPPR